MGWERTETEHDNLRAALRWSGAQGQAEAGLRLGGALWWFWQVRCYWREAREHVAGLLALPGAEGRRAARAQALQGAGWLAWLQGDYGAARARFAESLAICREVGDKRGTAQNLEGLAALAVTQGESERAARLFGAAEGLREAIGAPLPPAERAEHDRSVAAVRTALGEAGEARFGREADSAGGRAPGFTAAWAEGRAMSLDEAVAFAPAEAPC